MPKHAIQCLYSEQSVLGAMLLDRDAALAVVDKLKPEMFADPRHETLYRFMLRLLAENKPVDMVTVASELGEKLRIETGGSLYLANLVDAVPSVVNAEEYAAIVLEKWQRRQMINACRQIAELASDEDGDLEQQIAEAEQLVFSLAQESKEGPRRYGEIASKRWEMLYNNRDRDSLGIQTGFRDIDGVLGGMQPSDLIIIAARPGEGKTTLAQNIAENVAREGSEVLFFSLEMSAEAIIDRSVCSEARIDGRRVRAKTLPDAEWDRAADTVSKLLDLPLWIDDDGAATSLEIRSRARKHQAKYGLKLVIVDYLQLIKDKAGYQENRNIVVGRIAQNMKLMAKELKVPVIVLSQLNREGENSRPNKAMLRDSGEIEAVADVIMFIHTPDEAKKQNLGTREIIVDKHRNGPTGKIDLVFLKQFVKFVDYAKGA